MDTFHRVGSAHYQKELDVQQLKLPLLLQQDTSRSTQSIPNIFASQNSLERLSTLRETQTQREARLKDRDRWIGAGLYESDNKSVSQDAVSRFVEMPVRRHMQEEQMSKEARRAEKLKALRKKNNKSLTSFPSRAKNKRKLKWTTDDFQSREATTGRSEMSKFSSVYTSASAGDADEVDTARLPEEATQIISWYIDQWTDTKKNEFLHKLVLKLDPRQHYFISSFLSLKHHKDIVGLLPDHLALKILQYLSPKELLTAGQVSKRWTRLANDNSLWRAKCEETTLEIPVPSAPEWKRVYKDNLYLRLNWNKGYYSTVDFRGHTHSVLCVTCDENRLASGSSDKTIKVWDIHTGHLQHTLKGHSKGVWCLQFFTKLLLVSGSFDSTIRVWNLRTGTTTRTLLGHTGQIWCLKRHGPYIVSGSQDKTAKVWDIGRSLLVHTLVGHNAAVFSLDIAEDGSLIVTGSADRSVRMWRSTTGQIVKVVWVSPTISIMAVSYSRGYFACSYDGTICLYKGAKLVKTFNEHRKRVESVNLRIVDAEQGQGYIISAGKDGFIKYWDITQDDSVQTFTGHREPINCIYVDERRIASASYDHKIRVWDFNVGMPPIEKPHNDEEETEIGGEQEGSSDEEEDGKETETVSLI
ncbi:hypothetical protein EGW08_000007 [Elysia chlorotica]|uniref:F-box domain-containing protein n=1 Tax=Elysia chlorotica TaxID=188477 RepID=A0A3S1BVG2_ELYCH|nr:hypothetical protein EGW08_000007 [Elysia chlorotica]